MDWYRKYSFPITIGVVGICYLVFQNLILGPLTSEAKRYYNLALTQQVNLQTLYQAPIAPQVDNLSRLLKIHRKLQQNLKRLEQWVVIRDLPSFVKGHDLTDFRECHRTQVQALAQKFSAQSIELEPPALHLGFQAGKIKPASSEGLSRYYYKLALATYLMKLLSHIASQEPGSIKHIYSVGHPELFINQQGTTTEQVFPQGVPLQFTFAGTLTGVMRFIHTISQKGSFLSICHVRLQQLASQNNSEMVKASFLLGAVKLEQVMRPAPTKVVSPHVPNWQKY